MSDNDHTAYPDGYYGNYGRVDALPDGIKWLKGAVAPTDGVAGTGAGTAGPGSRYTDTATNIEYRQNGTLASPVWNPIHAP